MVSRGEGGENDIGVLQLIHISLDIINALLTLDNPGKGIS